MSKSSGFIPYLVPESLRDFQVTVGGERQAAIAESLMKRGPKQRVSDLVANIGRELVAVGPRPDIMTRVERVMRIVWDQAESGDQWAINFLADRMEGRPTQKLVVHNTEGDIRDIPTSELLQMAADDPQAGPQMAEAFEAEVQARVRQVLAAMGTAPQISPPAEISVEVIPPAKRAPVARGSRGAGRKSSARAKGR